MIFFILITITIVAICGTMFYRGMAMHRGDAVRVQQASQLLIAFTLAIVFFAVWTAVFVIFSETLFSKNNSELARWFDIGYLFRNLV